jgi:hypothetical protein
MTAPDTAPAQWQDISTAPKDGKPFFVWADGYSWPEVVMWGKYSEQDAKELGVEGYWQYADENLAEIAPEIEWEGMSHWMPIPPPPEPRS